MNLRFAIGMLAAAGLALSTSSLANEVVLTEGTAKQGNGRLALDFVNSGSATAFEFEIVVPKGTRQVDTSSCLSELPGTHTGACKFNSEVGRVVVIVYSNENKPLPDGLVSLGWIGIQSKRGGATLEKLLVSDKEGRPLPQTTTEMPRRDSEKM